MTHFTEVSPALLENDDALNKRDWPGADVKARVAHTVVVLALAAAAALLPWPAFAQLPPHAPGTICVTQFFWCWAQPPGPPGYACGCPSQYGFVPGYLG
ncbi:MAG: hypothetical protein E5W38_12410 [Mesorhizobium sp.]|uniref:hypothetical protein n=1 Tax=Mesorhizobium sp. M1E.F.Ca.ET.041.01.1.1 TaxID=2496759 RepID=UPI000FC99E6C|nr:hypothetical protein [Mesorhizobium sp. M1E.F.Ca.ET.041.01.1.1]RUW26322.1 hypothetical protein EOA38_27170 [Mesorhizobium sp. M1E.F.Ca.ET.041.01.1.1]RWD94913.1 MAG: hypothetical protein EOS39_04365 [Mesorhizobium sp.]TIU32519.1 MAG: hypothetical protein E5W38_12410 [Mesorhizobium sp.]